MWVLARETDAVSHNLVSGKLKISEHCLMSLNNIINRTTYYGNHYSGI